MGVKFAYYNHNTVTHIQQRLREVITGWKITGFFFFIFILFCIAYNEHVLLLTSNQVLLFLNPIE